MGHDEVVVNGKGVFHTWAMGGYLFGISDTPLRKKLSRRSVAFKRKLELVSRRFRKTGAFQWGEKSRFGGTKNMV